MVNRDLFYEEMERTLEELVIENFNEEIFELGPTSLECIMCPLVSDNVVTSGGMDGSYKFPKKLIVYLQSQ